jgi:DNA-directed RNA polymerase subunit M
MLKPKHEKGKNVLKCSCGYIKKDAEKVQVREKFARDSGPTGVVEEHLESLPLTEALCPKCGHTKARYWMIQTRAGDESETKFLKCEKCKHTWRDYS